MPSSKLGIRACADLLHRLLHRRSSSSSFKAKRLLEEEADCAAVDAIISLATIPRQRRHWGSHVTDRDCPPCAAPAPSGRRAAAQSSLSSVPVG